MKVVTSETAMQGDRRAIDRGTIDRRRSPRWELNKPIDWRVYRGRRVRRSWIVERSMDGIAMMVAQRDAVTAGKRMVVLDMASAERFGFRSAIVRRTESRGGDERMLFAEIEA